MVVHVYLVAFFFCLKLHDVLLNDPPPRPAKTYIETYFSEAAGPSDDVSEDRGAFSGFPHEERMYENLRELSTAEGLPVPSTNDGLPGLSRNEGLKEGIYSTEQTIQEALQPDNKDEPQFEEETIPEDRIFEIYGYIPDKSQKSQPEAVSSQIETKKENTSEKKPIGNLMPLDEYEKQDSPFPYVPEPNDPSLDIYQEIPDIPPKTDEDKANKKPEPPKTDENLLTTETSPGSEGEPSPLSKMESEPFQSVQEPNHSRVSKLKENFNKFVSRVKAILPSHTNERFEAEPVEYPTVSKALLDVER
ncbi:hypothetical protein RF11_00452 [Thelohanellus kitauei]|uniref:Uncharacterized protein n=1 Tax=Thelohanellus kitauei TaxID=669202 RepID=A0A0C2MZP9_THEKT|nr:hypothetical protein RF11_00452 [Thelohanellus kitauei]